VDFSLSPVGLTQIVDGSDGGRGGGVKEVWEKERNMEDREGEGKTMTKEAKLKI
jgi:hypothetical protein